MSGMLQLVEWAHRNDLWSWFLDDEFAIAEREVLAENTAQAVLKHLNRLEDTRDKLGTRCVWELLQNARDAAGQDGVTVEIQVANGQLRFQHNGRPFRHKEVAHLIYHGTTKLGDEANVGHFGSGFLSTHLLSRRVRVSGNLDGRSAFEFWIDRSGDDPDILSQAMQESMKHFRKSAEAGGEGDRSTTEFLYPLDAAAVELAFRALDELRACGPQVLAFAPEFVEIAVTTDSGSWSLSRSKACDQGARNAEVITVTRFDGEETSTHATVVLRTADVLVGLPLRGDSDSRTIAPVSKAPRVYVLFPLQGTDGLPLPAILQSSTFEPLEDRDGLMLDGDSPRAKTNRKVIESAIPLMKQMLDVVASEQWPGVESLCAFDASRLPENLDRPWFVRILRDLLKHARAASLMPAVDNSWIAPKSAVIPFGPSEGIRSRIWQLAGQWADYSNRLPPEDTAKMWADNIRHWTDLLECAAEDLPETLSIRRLVEEADLASTLDGLAERLIDEADPVSWIKDLLRLVLDADCSSLLDDFKVLPNQAGELCTRVQLAIDAGIEEQLKNIAGALEVPLRSRLLDPRAALPAISKLLEQRTEEQAVDDVVGALKSQTEEQQLPASLIRHAVDLFWWVVDRKQYHDRLDGLPVATSDQNEGEWGVTVLRRGDGATRPLAPAAVWPESARSFASMFPKKRTINEAYARQQDDQAWAELERGGYVYEQPLFDATRRLEEGLSAEQLPDGVEHESEAAEPMSCLAFLKDKDIGLIDGARKSKTRALRFIEFIVSYVLASDVRAFEHLAMKCDCDEVHNVFRAAWLEPLATRKWIPVESGAYISASSLAQLLANEKKLLSALDSDLGRQLLQALRISPADFALRVVAPDEDTRVSLIRSIGELAMVAGGADKVRDLVEQIRDDPGVLGALEDRKRNRERVRRNRDIGARIEELLREQLEESGLQVRRTGVGSDYEVESDFVQDEKEVLLELRREGHSTLVEVKSARVSRVKMTPTQVKTACESGERFALCVVPIEDEVVLAEDVRKAARFVFGIGSELQEAWHAFQGVESARDAALKGHGAVELEMGQQEVRFSIGSALWADGLGFDAAVAEFRRRGSSA